MVELLESDGRVRRTATAHVDPDKAALLRRAQELQPTARTDDSPVSQVIRTGQPVLLPRVPEELLDRLDRGTELADVYRSLGTHSAVVVPLRARRQVLGALSLVTADSRREYDEDDLTMAADLARRAALTVDNARLYEREHEVAMALQQRLLPRLPHVPGLD